MLNAIVSRVFGPAVFASMIACRSEPAPLAFVFVTVNVTGV